MKLLVSSLALAALTTSASGQSAPMGRTSIVYAPSTAIAADGITYNTVTNTTYARGKVRIVSELSTITADEADVHHLTDSRAAVDLAIDLRGNVRVVIAPSAAR